MTSDLDAAGDAMLASLKQFDRAVGATQDTDALMALRDRLLDFQFASRELITAIEERLGAFSGEDDPRVLATEAEALIEQIELLQDGWETRLELLLNAGFADDRLEPFLRDLLARPDASSVISELFTGMPADLDHTIVLLDYAKRYLLSLALPRR